MIETTFDEFVERSRRGTFVPVCREIMADLLTPVSAFLKIAEHSDYAFLLESVEGGEHVGRYSFLGKDPFLILRGRTGETTIEEAGVRTARKEPFIDVLRSLMAEFQAPFVPDLPRFTGGAVGYLDYDAADGGGIEKLVHGPVEILERDGTGDQGQLARLEVGRHAIPQPAPFLHLQLPRDVDAENVH